jgi:lipopolysaccharide export system ATP-binding protein
MAVLETLPLTAAERAQRLETLLDELELRSLRRSKAYVLSGGERRRLEITRALATNPTFMLLDEPFSGVDPLAILELRKIIEQLKKKGIGILLTDHNVRETLPVVDRAYILAHGKVVSQGTSHFLINDPVSRESYLGPEFSM